MAYDEKLANRIREALAHLPMVEEKKMFGGLTFLVNGKMCVSVSGEDMICRFDPKLHAIMCEKKYFKPVKVKGIEYLGYCYISPAGIKSEDEFSHWIGLCLQFNSKAKSSEKRNKARRLSNCRL